MSPHELHNLILHINKLPDAQLLRIIKMATNEFVRRGTRKTKAPADKWEKG